MIDANYFRVLLLVVCVLALIAAVTLGASTVHHAKMRWFCRTIAVLLGSTSGVAAVLLAILK